MEVWGQFNATAALPRRKGPQGVGYKAGLVSQRRLDANKKVLPVSGVEYSIIMTEISHNIDV
jgi:hypothetical protein